MVFNDQTSKWEKAPEPVKLPEPGKGEPTEKEAKADKAVQLKRRSETESEEPKAKKGSIASGPEKAKPVELKPASEVSQASHEKSVKDAGRADVPAVEKSEKKPHTPRSGIVLKPAGEVQQHDAGEKAPHGDSSLMTLCWQRVCRRQAASCGLPGKGWREAMVQDPMRWCVVMRTHASWKHHRFWSR